MKYLSTFVIFFLLAGCTPGQSHDYNYQPRTMFKTTPPARLYFKNMRSVYYDQLAGRPDSMDYYRLRQFPDPKDSPVLQAVIADNWLRDEAYLLLEFNAFPGAPKDTFRLVLRAGEQEEILRLAQVDPEAHQVVARQLLLALEAGREVLWQSEQGQTYKLFDSDSERSAFRTTTADYQRMTAP